MSTDEDLPRERLEREAELTRIRLAGDLDALDRRWHDALDVKRQLAAHAKGLLVGTAALLLGIAFTIGVAAYRKRRRRRRIWNERWSAVQRAWANPERVAPKG
jgi:hypothetical protein